LWKKISTFYVIWKIELWKDFVIFINIFFCQFVIWIEGRIYKYSNKLRYLFVIIFICFSRVRAAYGHTDLIKSYLSLSKSIIIEHAMEPNFWMVLSRAKLIRYHIGLKFLGSNVTFGAMQAWCRETRMMIGSAKDERAQCDDRYGSCSSLLMIFIYRLRIVKWIGRFLLAADTKNPRAIVKT